MYPIDPMFRKILLRMLEDLEGMFEELAKESRRNPNVRGYIFTHTPKGSFFKEIGGEEPAERTEMREEVVDAREPLVDIFEEGKRLRVLVELPGVMKEDISLSYFPPKMLVVKTKDGKFYKRIILPKEVDATKAKAKYKNGVLEVVLPLKKGGRGSTIKVE